MNTALFVILLTFASLTAVAVGGGALGLGVMKLVSLISRRNERRELPVSQRRAA